MPIFLIWEQRVAGSNPVSPTNFPYIFQVIEANDQVHLSHLEGNKNPRKSRNGHRNSRNNPGMDQCRKSCPAFRSSEVRDKHCLPQQP